MPKGSPQQRTRRWERTAAVALLLLGGGAVVNVAVAWVCAIAPGGHGVTQLLLSEFVKDSPFGPYHATYSHNASAGWPSRSMRWQPSGRPSEPFEQERLPLRPLASGFAFNTLFYALLLWLLFIAPFAARRALRRKRRLCEKCAYPVGTSPVCTECGAAVGRRA